MLILKRIERQSLRIDDEIELSVLNIKGEHIKIGIDAPEDITIIREELYLREAEDSEEFSAEKI
jgi:carbon storage regulator